MLPPCCHDILFCFFFVWPDVNLVSGTPARLLGFTLKLRAHSHTRGRSCSESVAPPRTISFSFLYSRFVFLVHDIGFPVPAPSFCLIFLVLSLPGCLQVFPNCSVVFLFPSSPLCLLVFFSMPFVPPTQSFLLVALFFMCLPFVWSLTEASLRDKLVFPRSPSLSSS